MTLQPAAWQRILSIWLAMIGLLTTSPVLLGDEPDGPVGPVVPAETEAELFKEVLVATREVPPFSMRNDDGRWEGISIDLLRRVAAEVNSELETELDSEITLEFREMPLDAMLDAVAAGEVDLAAAAITVNYEREKRLDFTHAYYTSGLGIAVGTTQRKWGWSGVVAAVFSPTFAGILAALFLAMLVSAVLVHVVERKHNAEDFGGGWLRGITKALWWAAVTLTTVGYGDAVPRSLAGRLIALVWMFAGLFIIAGFTAAVTTTLTVDQLRSKISGPADLPRVRVATIENSTSAAYLRRRHIAHQAHPNVDAALNALAAGECEAVVYDAPVLRYTVMKRHSASAHVLPGTFERQDYAFAIPSGSPVRERINQYLLREIGTASWEEVLNGYVGEVR